MPNSNPGFTQGQVPTAAQWNGYFTSKTDAVNGQLTTPIINGGTISNASVALPTSASVAAAGTTQGTATALNAQNNVVTTVAAGAGVLVQASPLNMTITILNRGANTLLIYPPVGAQFESYSVNEAVSIAAGATLRVMMITATQGYVF